MITQRGNNSPPDITTASMATPMAATEQAPPKSHSQHSIRFFRVFIDGYFSLILWYSWMQQQASKSVHVRLLTTATTND